MLTPDLWPPYRYAHMRQYSWAVTRTVIAQLRRTVTGDSACPKSIMVAQPATSSPGETDAAMYSRHHDVNNNPAIAAPTRRSHWSLRLLAKLKLWQQRSRSRRQLAQLDPRQLADTGISHAERQVELAKPFWR